MGLEGGDDFGESGQSLDSGTRGREKKVMLWMCQILEFMRACTKITFATMPKDGAGTIALICWKKIKNGTVEAGNTMLHSLQSEAACLFLRQTV